MELDRPHLDAGEQPADVVQIEIVLGLPVLFLDRDLLHARAERALVVLLEEAFLRGPLGAADERHRALGRIDHDQGIDLRIIIGELALGDPVLGIDHPVLAADLDAEARRGCALLLLLALLQVPGHFAHDLARRLVLPERNEARVAKDPVAGEFAEGDLRDEHGLQPMRPLAVGARHLERRLLDLERRHSLHQLLDQPGIEAGADLAGVGELALFLHRQQ